MTGALPRALTGGRPSRTTSLIVGLAVACLAGCAGIKAQTHSYATLAEAREAGAIAGGWVPDGLPAGTYDIQEAHVPGTTDRWGIVNFPTAESEVLRGLLGPALTDLKGQRADAPGRVEWWPVVLRGEIDGATLAAAGVTAHRARSSDLIFAVNWKQGRAYYWPSR